MIALGILELLRNLILVVFGAAGQTVVTELPYGMQEAVDLFAYSMHSIVQVLPMLEIMYTLFFWGIGVKIALLSIQFVMWILERIK